MKRILAACATVIIMSAVLYVGMHRKSSSGLDAREDRASSGFASSTSSGRASELGGAAERIDLLLKSAHDGDVAQYLGSFAGPLRARLQREADERGRAAFARQLKSASRARKSHALFSPVPEDASGAAVKVTLESVFTDRVERQNYRLEHIAAGWLVTAIETARQDVPRIPLGSVATYREPEGEPVPMEFVRQVADAGPE
jgi:hypothetical protein